MATPFNGMPRLELRTASAKYGMYWPAKLSPVIYAYNGAAFQHADETMRDLYARPRFGIQERPCRSFAGTLQNVQKPGIVITPSQNVGREPTSGSSWSNLFEGAYEKPVPAGWSTE